MRIIFQRMGGFTGLRLSTVLESQDLDEPDLQALEEEIKLADFFNLPDRIKPVGGGADRFEYHIDIEWQRNEHSVVVGESAMPETLRPLVEHLELLMRTRR